MFQFCKTTGQVAIIFLLLLPFLLVSTNANAAAPEQLIFVAVNDELVEFADAKPFTTDGVTYIPLRSLADVMKAEVLFDDVENSVTVRKDSTYLKIFINEKSYENESGEKKPLNIKSVNNRTLVPMRFIAEYLQLEVIFYDNGPIARLIDHHNAIQLTNEQLYLTNKDQIESEKLKWNAKHEQQASEEQDRSKIAYLTFDDGPNGNTSKILDILKEYDVHATFFMIEPKTKNYKKVVERMVLENHYIASHSVTHDKNKVYKSPEALLNEMNTTRAALLSITGVDSHLIRVPYGSKPYLTKEFRNALVDNNLKVWDWNVDSNDWRYSTEETISQVKKQVKNLKQRKTTPVILFHDRANTVEALPIIIEFLKAEGYELKSYDPGHHFIMNFWHDERI